MDRTWFCFQKKWDSATKVNHFKMDNVKLN